MSTTVTLLWPFDPRRTVVSDTSLEDWIVFLETWEELIFAFRGIVLAIFYAYKADAIGFVWLNFGFFFLEAGPKVALKQLRKKVKDGGGVRQQVRDGPREEPDLDLG